MRLAILTLALSLAAGGALAQTSKGLDPVTTVQCIEVSGQSIPAVCTAPGSRLDKREYLCTCPDGGMRVDVPVCAKDQPEPAEGKALIRARRDAHKDGSLVGDMIDGRQICVAPRGRL